ncbi:MAG: hypothetical protein LIP03_04125 [Bacteroidales bacterium]|nr:hypothetical protein [Bacteroidales bacterium]
MISSQDLNKLLTRYREEGYPNGVSVEEFAKNYGVDPKVFNNWMRAASQRMVQVKVIHDEPKRPKAEATAQQAAESSTPQKKIAKVTVCLADGTSIMRNNLSCRELSEWAGKLEALC